MQCKDRNCLECELDECIYESSTETKEQHRLYQARWREKNRERVRENGRKWRRAHADEINQKLRDNRLLSRKCDYCHMELRHRNTVQKYGKYYFCTNKCLSEHLLQKSIEKGFVKTIIMPHREQGGE